MDPDRWLRIQDIWLEAVDLASDARPAFLDRACGSDAPLRAEVDSLLAADADADPLLDASLDELVLMVLEPSARRRDPSDDGSR